MRRKITLTDLLYAFFFLLLFCPLFLSSLYRVILPRAIYRCFVPAIGAGGGDPITA